MFFVYLYKQKIKQIFMEWFKKLNHVYQALIATLFTWGVAAAGKQVLTCA
jgi:hypothetical protein